MKDFKEFINEFDTGKSIESIVTFFVDNEWFGESIVMEQGKIILSDAQIERFTKARKPLYICNLARNFQKQTDSSISFLLKYL